MQSYITPFQRSQKGQHHLRHTPFVPTSVPSVMPYRQGESAIGGATTCPPAAAFVKQYQFATHSQFVGSVVQNPQNRVAKPSSK